MVPQLQTCELIDYELGAHVLSSDDCSIYFKEYLKKGEPHGTCEVSGLN